MFYACFNLTKRNLFYQNSTSRPNILRYDLRYPDFFFDGILPRCFTFVQNQLEKAFISIFHETNISDINLTSFGYSRSTKDDFIILMKTLLPIVLIFSTFYTATQIIKVSQTVITRNSHCYVAQDKCLIQLIKTNLECDY